MREQLKELTKQYDKSENDLKALQSVGQVRYDISYIIVIRILCFIHCTLRNHVGSNDKNYDDGDYVN